MKPTNRQGSTNTDPKVDELSHSQASVPVRTACVRDSTWACLLRDKLEGSDTASAQPYLPLLGS